MSSCGVCVKNIKINQSKLTCFDCKRDFHAACLKYSKADVDCLNEEGLVWRCKDCQSTRRKSMRLESAADEGKLSLEDIMKVVTDIRDSQAKYEKSFNKACESMDSQLIENTKALKAQQEQNEKLYQLIESITSENKEAEEEGESSGRSSGEHRAVLSHSFVDWTRRSFLQRRRVKRTLLTRHIGATDDRPVYVNESLSPARRALYALARKYQREKNFKFLWVRNGKIFLRKEEKALVRVITREEGLGLN
ncbi:uncharacterized protein LOC124355198 [Homalodisca vitripennis]|uniref:uncharacterized protein LOC124355198 n=1 Tax=Homalodisca vitripennis TaxID=197043 RepID=UPI001EEBE3BA|nr:uncharacterized protein LOC124355198 [Homalodisca vitripennis]